MNRTLFGKFKQLVDRFKTPIFVKVFYFFLFFIILAIPSHQANWFDGLPWSTPIEFLTLVAIIPFLLLLNRDFLSQKWVGIFLLSLLAIKLLTVVSLPPNGLKLWVYNSEEAMKANDWKRTYTTLIKPGSSEVFVRDFTRNTDFPIEWGNVRYLEPTELWVGIKFSGAFRTPIDTQLGFIADGLQQGEIITIGPDNAVSNVAIYNNAEEVSFYPDRPQLKSGRIEGEITYKQGNQDWSLIPVVIFPDGHYVHANDQNIFWQNEPIFNISPFWLTAGQILAALIDLSILFFLGTWLVFSIKKYLPAGRWPVVFGVVIAALALILREPYFETVLPIVERTFGHSSAEYVEHSYLTLWVLAAAGILLIWYRWVRARGSHGTLRAWQLILITGAPLVLSFFLYKYWGVIDRVEFMGDGDWLTYQIFARQIVVDGDIWHTGQAILNYQPLYRYIVGLLHLFFGQSTASQYFLNFWSVLITAMIISRIAEQWEVSNPYAVLGGFIIIAIHVTPPFWDILLRALQEHPGSLFVVLTAWSIIAYQRDKKWHYLFLACLFGVTGLLIRMDHLFIIAAVSLFYLEPLFGSLKEVWKRLIRGLFNNWKVFAILGLVLTLGLLAVASRNWIMGGKFILSESQIRNPQRLENRTTIERFWGITQILGTDALRTGILLETTLPAAVILSGGTLVSLIALGWRGGLFRNFNLSLGLICLSGIVPYYFFMPRGYYPRWSIHLLPFATLAVIIFIDRFLKRKRSKSLV